MRSISLLICFVFLVAACKDQSQQPGLVKSIGKPDTVKSFALQAGKIEKQTTLPGELLSYEQAEIHPKVAGYVKDMKVDIGSIVRKGQVLAIVEAPEIQSGVEAASGKMQAAKAKYEASRDTYKRVLEASGSDGVIAPDELQRARNQMLADSADYKSTVFAAQSSRQVGNYLVIVAPFNGIITQRNVHEGAYVGNPNQKGILEIRDNSRLRLQVAVPEALTGVQLKDNKIHFSTKANPDQLFEGSLVRRSGSIDPATRTETWEFEIKNDKNALKPGAFADVKLEVSRSRPSFLVPFPAIVTTLEKKFVIRVRGGITEWVDVSQGINLTDRTEIFGKLNEGDTLVSKGNEEIKAGTRVVAKLSN